jgi:hypothetical protein
VKQFKGFAKNWAYTYVWEQFRAKHLDYLIVTFVDSTSDESGLTTSAMNAHELWSTGTETLTTCTRAVGGMYTPGKLYGGAETDKRC